jgi:myo-inositol-1(or 4)-monophosphatase
MNSKSSTPTDERLKRTILRAVKEAAHIVRGHCASGPARVSEKSSPGDLVSNVDLEVESAVTAILSREFPRIPLVGEEGGEAATRDEAFYLDPVDGTLNFVHGLPPFAVSLGYWREGAPAAAAVCNPVAGDLFAAFRGCGASRNGKPISPSRAATLRASLIATGWPYDRSRRERLYGEMDRVYLASQELRTIGCASLGLCYVACGIFDGYWEWGLQPWDLAAGVLIVSEAGGRVSSLAGGPFRLEDGGAAASNGLIHEELVRTVKG